MPDTVARLATATEAFLAPLRALDGFDPDAFAALYAALEACAIAWADSDTIPKAGASILVDLYNAVEAASYGYPTEEGVRIRQAASALDELVGRCVAWQWSSSSLWPRSVQSEPAELTQPTRLVMAWTVWLNATSETKARRVLERLFKELDRVASDLTLEPYPKTSGFTARFAVSLDQTRRNDAIIEAIEVGQRVAYDWTLGSLRDEWPGAMGVRPRIAGVDLLEWDLARP